MCSPRDSCRSVYQVHEENAMLVDRGACNRRGPAKGPLAGSQHTIVLSRGTCEQCTIVLHHQLVKTTLFLPRHTCPNGSDRTRCCLAERSVGVNQNLTNTCFREHNATTAFGVASVSKLHTQILCYYFRLEEIPMRHFSFRLFPAP
jgi:hypothetical protein